VYGSTVNDPYLHVAELELPLCLTFLYSNTSQASTMSSGLTRRRGGGGGGGGGAGLDNDEGDSSRVASPAPKAGGSRDIGGPETSYESGENGHKIAFDPRDINESAERSKQPKLTLMEEVLLLGLKDKQVSGLLWQLRLNAKLLTSLGYSFVLERQHLICAARVYCH
jgi:hypothetical protein